MDLNIDQIDAKLYINNGPNFLNLTEEQFFREDNYLGVPMKFEIYSSINSMYRYGYIMIQDRIGMRESLPLTGNQIISIRYINPKTPNVAQYYTERIIHFNIFDIEEINLTPNANKDQRFTNKALKLHVVEAPFFYSYNGSTHTKTYGIDSGTGVISGPRIDEIIRDFLENNLNIKDGENGIIFDFHEMSKDVSRFTCPKWKAQKFFDYILDFARDKDDGGNVKLFTTTDRETGYTKINLKSILGMFTTPQYIYEYSIVSPETLQKISQTTDVSNINTNVIYHYKFVSYNFAETVSGLGGGQIYGFDYLTGNYYACFDTYSQSLLRNKFFQNFGLWNESISNFNSKQYSKYGRSIQTAKNYLNNKTIENNFQLRCEALSVVNQSVEIGDVLFITFMSGMAPYSEGQGNVYDEQMSGKWVVEEIHDFYNHGKSFRKFILVKDSYFNIYDPSTDSRKQLLPNVTTIDGAANG